MPKGKAPWCDKDWKSKSVGEKLDTLDGYDPALIDLNKAFKPCELSAVWGRYGTAKAAAAPETKEQIAVAKTNKDKRCGLRGWISDRDFGENFKHTIHDVVGSDCFRKTEQWISWGV